MKSFVNEMFTAAKLENVNGDENEIMHCADDYFASDMHFDMLNQIEDAITFQLEHEYEYQEDGNQIYCDEEELAEHARIDLYDDDENTIICPMCR